MHHTGGLHGDEEGLQGEFPSPAGCQEELQIPPNLGMEMAVAIDSFVEFLIRSLGFSSRRQYIGEGARSVEYEGAHTRWRRG